MFKFILAWAIPFVVIFALFMLNVWLGVIGLTGFIFLLVFFVFNN